MNNINPASPSIGSFRKSPFSVHTIESLTTVGQLYKTVEHTQPDFEIVWILDGQGYHKVNECEYQLAQSKAYCVLPGQRHQLVIMPGTKGFIISFTEDFFVNGDGEDDSTRQSCLTQLFLQTPELTISDTTAEDMRDVLSLMLREITKYSFLRPDIINKYLKIFMAYFRNELEKVVQMTPRKTSCFLVNQFFTVLESSFKDHRTVSHYAKTLFITPNYLNHLIKSSTGFSARYHIQQRILLAAKAAIRDRSSMKEIAFYLGFEDIAHFSKFFKNVSGLNFRDFKKQLEDDYFSVPMLAS
ncbi:helix-turn-helix domain-containing protein [Chitinophaga sp. CF418]|uniref:helix-turn-helix domain-containing protein n=1 Tax=Chitinophaga sp. CF418 TaxID=1855287 RepID=UPI00091CE865|nr:helix-turn-helix domain-containing protein [Chitinophaga sp. CF418]SHN35894.1 AraC-type DNA-binding protein [Chitinophaga sp. CF418]